MTGRIFWITRPGLGRLAIVVRPRPDDWLEEDIAAWRSNGLDAIVCLLEPAESGALGLAREAELCREHGLDFLAFPISDRGVPQDQGSFAGLIHAIGARLDQGESVGIHCRASIGRTGIVTAACLVAEGNDPEAAFARISEARGIRVPDTDEQAAWLAAAAATLRR